MHVLHFMPPPPCLAVVASLALRNLGYNPVDLHWDIANPDRKAEVLAFLRRFIKEHPIRFAFSHAFYGIDKDILAEIKGIKLIDHSYDVSFAAFEALRPEIESHPCFHIAHEPNELVLYRDAGVQFLSWLPFGMASAMVKPLLIPEDSTYEFDVLFVGRTHINAPLSSVEAQLQDRGIADPHAFMEALVDYFPERSLADLLGQSDEDIARKQHGQSFFSDLYRVLVIKRLIERERMKVTVVGDPTWLNHIPAAHFSGGPADGRALYGKAKINLDFTRANYFGTTNIRVFDILSASGFCISDNSPLQSGAYTDGELPMYRNYKDLVAKIRHYLSRPLERREMLYKGWAATVSRHTYEQRILEILSRVAMQQKPQGSP